MAADHKTNFDNSVRDLEAVYNRIVKAQTIPEISQAEREVRNALLSVIHYANFLSFWVRDAADKRRREIRDGAFADLKETSKEEAPKTTKAKRAKKTKKRGK